MSKAGSKTQSPTAAGTYVALLRGINLAGKNKLAMADLTELFAEAGCADVRTYIQSGNVVFAASAACAKRLPKAMAKLIAERFKLAVPIVLRSAAELHSVCAANPFLKRGADFDPLHVAFLADAPGKQAITSLDRARSPGDSFEVVGREIYLHLPNGMARTKLTNAYFDSRLKTVSTVRNWRTVLKLTEMAQVIGS